MSGTDLTSSISFEVLCCPKCGLELDASITVCPKDGTAVSTMPEIGELFEEKYEFLERRAAGGMGVVYKAKQRALNRTVAIKLLQSGSPSATSVRRFQQEAKALAALDHANLVRVLELGVTSYGQLYTVMEYVDGKGLDEVLTESRPSLKKTLNIFGQVCDALAYVHEFGIYHRDLKPSNIMLIDPFDENPKVKIVDFGIAKVLDSERTNTLTQTGEMFGSPLYMSPEQAKGGKIDQRTDLYSLGCVLYEVLTGVPPFSGASIVEIIFQHVGEKHKSLATVSPGQKYPNALETLVSKLLEKDPANRYQTAAAVRDDLNKLASQNKGWYHINVPGIEPSAPSSTWTRTALIGSGSMLASLLVFLVYGFFFGEKGELAKVDTNMSASVTSGVSDLVDDTTRKIAKIKDESNISNVKGNYEVISLLMQKDRLKLMCIRNPASFLHLNERKDRCVSEITAYAINDAGVAAMPDFPLHVIDFKHAPITSASIKRIAQFPSLNVLDLTDVRLSPQDCQQLQKLNKLVDLRMIRSHLNDECVKNIAQIKHLTQLHLAKNPDITDKAVSYLVAANLPLYDLDLGLTNVSDSAVPQLAKLEGLETLCLAGTHVTDRALPDLGKFKNLRNLDLSHTTVTDGALSKFKAVRLLRLSLSGCGYTAEGVRMFKKLNPECLVFPDDDSKVKSDLVLATENQGESPTKDVEDN